MSDPFEPLRGSSDAMHALRERARRVAATPLPVLLSGETGTGKEVLARCVHAASGRTGAFVPVDCAAMLGSLVESALFGHQRGAFTGANQRREGLVHAAEGGTLFLDEVAELSPQMQTRLLRLLEAGTYRPLGSDVERHANIRVLAATWKDLHKEVNAQRFRQDLYHRIAVVELRLPPLRDRRDDIRGLAESFLTSTSVANDRTPPSLSTALWSALESRRWPGNVRELRNLMSYLAVVPRGAVLGPSDLPTHFAPDPVPHSEQPAVRLDLPYLDARRRWLDTFQDAYIRGQLRAHDGNISAAARAACMDRRSIQRFLGRTAAPEPQDE